MKAFFLFFQILRRSQEIEFQKFMFSKIKVSEILCFLKLKTAPKFYDSKQEKRFLSELKLFFVIFQVIFIHDLF